MKAEMTHFWHHWLFVNMPITKEDKTLIKNLFPLEGQERRFVAKMECRQCLQVSV